MYLGIDQSYTGFATTLLSVSGAYEVRCRALKGEGTDRLHDAASIIYGILDSRTLTAVGLEGYSFGSANRAHMAGELGGVIRYVLTDVGMDPLVIPPTVVKMYATGKGNAKKNEVLLGVYKNWGIEFSDDNEADSFVIAKIVSGEHSNAAQEKAINKVHGKSA